MEKYNFRRIESDYCGKHLVSERWQTQLQKGTNQVTAKVFIIDNGQVAFIQENEADSVVRNWV